MVCNGVWSADTDLAITLEEDLDEAERAVVKGQRRGLSVVDTEAMVCVAVRDRTRLSVGGGHCC